MADLVGLIGVLVVGEQTKGVMWQVVSKSDIFQTRKKEISFQSGMVCFQAVFLSRGGFRAMSPVWSMCSSTKWQSSQGSRSLRSGCFTCHIC